MDLFGAPTMPSSAPILELSQPLFSEALFVKVVCNWLVSFEVVALVLAKGLLDSWQRRIWVLEPILSGSRHTLGETIKAKECV
jgi:hypothetical protein